MPLVADNTIEATAAPKRPKLLCIDGKGTKLSSVDLEILRLTATALRRAKRHPEGRQGYQNFFKEVAWIAACAEHDVGPGVVVKGSRLTDTEALQSALTDRFILG